MCPTHFNINSMGTGPLCASVKVITEISKVLKSQASGKKEIQKAELSVCACTCVWDGGVVVVWSMKVKKFSESRSSEGDIVKVPGYWA